VPSSFDSILDTLESISAELNVLTARLNAIEQGSGYSGAAVALEGGSEGRPPGAPIVWARIPDEERGVVWEAFVDWALWLADTFELTAEQLPRNCWWRHGSAVEELSALWTSYQSAYFSAKDVESATYLWLDALSRCIERLNRMWLGGCTRGFHQAKTRTPFRDDEEYRAQIVAEVGGGPVAPDAPPGEGEPSALA
jgi:hypothetical protein